MEYQVQPQIIEARNMRPADSKGNGTDQPKEIVVPQMRAHFAPDTLNEESRTVEVVFGSENPTVMWTWEHGQILESLSFNQEHVRLGRLNSGAPLLDNHQWRYGSVADTVVGVIEKAWTGEKKGHATVRFSKGEKADKILDMVRERVLRNISVGYAVNKYEVTRATERDGLDLFRAVDWEPHEISLVAVPADYTAQVRSLQTIEIREDPEELKRKEDEKNKQTLQRRRAEIDILLAANTNT